MARKPRRPQRPPGDKSLGEELQRAREEAGLYQKHLAPVLGFAHPQDISEIENGKAGLFEEQWKTAFNYLWARREFGPPILEMPSSRPTIEELWREYPEERWVSKEFDIPFISMYASRDEKPVFLTYDQVEVGDIDEINFQPGPLSNLRDRILGSYVQLYPDTRIFEGLKARLIQAEYVDGSSTHDRKLVPKYERAAYGDNIITHQLLNYLLTINPDDEKPLTPPTSLKNILLTAQRNGHLPPIGSNSPLANTVGRGGLIFTQNHELLYVRRSGRVAVDANLFDLPVQGSSDIKMSEKHYDVFTDFKQEAQDELLIQDKNWARLQSGVEALYLMGLLRNTATGGKPDYFFVGKVGCDMRFFYRWAHMAEHAWERILVTNMPSDTKIHELHALCADKRYTSRFRVAIILLIDYVRERGLKEHNTLHHISKMLF